MADSSPKPYSADPTLYLYTSLTAGSSHIITATSRLETILKANKIPFRAVDVATDERARMLWGRRSKGKKIPGLVKFGQVIGDLEEIEEWNEYGELKQNLGSLTELGVMPTSTPSTSTTNATPDPTTTSENYSRSTSETRSQKHISIAEPGGNREAEPSNTPKKDDTPLAMTMRQAGAEAAAKAGQKKMQRAAPPASTKPTTGEAPVPVVDSKADRTAADPDTAEITAGKHPTQLASEGAQRTTVDKIANSENAAMAPATTSPHSNEEQVLEARRTSSITKQPSRLAEQTSIDAVDNTSELKPNPEHDEHTVTMHRGSSISHASKEEVAAIEKADKIDEEDEDDDKAPDKAMDDANAMKASEKEISATDMYEKKATEDVKPQQQETKDETATGVSVGD